MSMSILGGTVNILKAICFWTGVAVWVAAILAVLWWAYHLTTSAVSVTRWHWRCSLDLKPRWRDLIPVFFYHLKDIAVDGPPDLMIGRSYWRSKSDWKIVPEPKPEPKG